MKFNKKKYNEDGYFVVKKIITKKDIDLFFLKLIRYYVLTNIKISKYFLK